MKSRKNKKKLNLLELTKNRTKKIYNNSNFYFYCVILQKRVSNNSYSEKNQNISFL